MNMAHRWIETGMFRQSCRKRNVAICAEDLASFSVMRYMAMPIVRSQSGLACGYGFALIAIMISISSTLIGKSGCENKDRFRLKSVMDGVKTNSVTNSEGVTSDVHTGQ